MDNEFIGYSLAIWAIAIISLGSMFALSRHENSQRWNYGYCQCGGKWEYKQALPHAQYTGYLYQCDKCGKATEMSEKYAEN